MKAATLGFETASSSASRSLYSMMSKLGILGPKLFEQLVSVEAEMADMVRPQKLFAAKMTLAWSLGMPLTS